MAARPGTGRLGTASRGAGYGRVGTAQRLGTGRVGTGRLGTGRMGTGSRAAAEGGVLAAQVRVPDRPMTRQGLGGMAGPKTASGGRLIQDESYFVGALRQKNSELQTEVTSLQAQIKTLERDQDSYQSYEKRAETLTEQITTLQGELGDLNMLEDQVNQHIEVEDVRDDVDDLKKQNDQKAGENDEIFAERQRLEAATKQVEADTQAEKEREEQLVNEMPEAMQAAYRAKQAENQAMQEQIAEQNETIDAVGAQIQQCEGELQRNPIKREAVNLHREIAELEAKRNGLQREVEEADMGTPEEQRERLLQQVKDNNQQIATMERTINDLGNRANELQSELADLDSVDDNASDDKRQKYLELVKRDQEMDKFLGDFDGIRADEKMRLDEAEEKIVGMLETISTLLQRSGAMPSRDQASSNRHDLSVKQSEMSRAEQTRASLQERKSRHEKDLQNVKSLESKIRTEMEQLTTKISTMETDMVTYNDIEGLREVTDAKKRRLQKDRASLTMRRDTSKRVLAELSAQYDSLKAQLAENETYQQLEALQKKWLAVVKTNQQMKSFIDSQETQSNWKPYSKEVAKLVKTYNADLKARDPVRNISRAV